MLKKKITIGKQKYMSLYEAKRLSMIKWQMIVDNNGNKLKYTDMPLEVRTLNSSCGFCARSNKKHFYVKNIIIKSNTVCDVCELGDLIGNCNQSNSIYYCWSKTNNDEIRLDCAKQILEKIKSINCCAYEWLNPIVAKYPFLVKLKIIKIY